MRKRLMRTKVLCVAMALTAFAAVGFVSSASAHTPPYDRFNFCPSTTPGVFKCLQAITKGGKVVLGKKTVPIVNPVTLQGGSSEPNEVGDQKFFGATNGITLSKTPQPVPGGLAGIINCKEISNIILRISCEVTFENGLTGLNATLELARPASEIVVSETKLLTGEGTALRLPLKVHLENPFLGSSCYVGSSSSPIIWNLTTGTTAPPLPNKPITGALGTLSFLDEGGILIVSGNKIVDNAWSAPKASGCGGPIVELLLNPIINSQVGLPSPAGKNTAELGPNTLSIALAETVNEH
jgi:hypothetical protein